LRKEARKKKLKIPRFRSGKCSLKARTDKKLLERYNWFKKRKTDESDEIDDENSKENDKKWTHYNKRKPVIKAIEAVESENVEPPPKAVLFVQNTLNGEN